MKLLLIRHGEPDYERDELTERGKKEAEYLSERLSVLDVKDFYVSPLKRAKQTAKPTLEKTGRRAKELDWLREFTVGVFRPDKQPERSAIPWDWLPADWTAHENFYSYEKWWDNEIFREANLREKHDVIIDSFDKLLAEYGYIREKHLYKAVKSNEDTLVFFCHFGLTGILIAHLLGISPMVVWQGMCSLTTSVTTLVTEERRRGIAAFRMTSFSDCSHLYIKNQQPSFAARFCEIFDSEDRH